MDNAKLLSNFQFHKVIDRPKESYTILSATSTGLIFGQDETLGSVISDYPKAINVFAESVTLGQPDSLSGITFGSTETEEIILSTTHLTIEEGAKTAIISARGEHGEPNAAGSEISRGKTNGRPGHNLRVYIGQAPSNILNISYEARGGDGATTIETEVAAGSGGNGGSVEVIYLSTWAPILQHLHQVVAMVRVSKKVPKSLRDEALSEAPDPIVFNHLRSIIIETEKLSSKSDPLRKKVVNSLSSLLKSDVIHTTGEVYETLKETQAMAKEDVNEHARQLRRSANSAGGYGGRACESAGERGDSGQDGTRGKVATRTILDSTVVGPLSFPPLHPLQCQMQIDMARALMYIGEPTTIDRANQLLSQLSAKIHAVVDAADDDSDEVKKLSDKEREERNIRIRSLRESYESRRNLMGIPLEMEDPVLELRRIARRAADMLFQTTQASIDIYGYAQTWAPRLSVKTFGEETKASLQALEKAEGSYLLLAKDLDEVQRDESLCAVTISQMKDGLEQLSKERKYRADKILELRDKILGQTLKAEISRQADEVQSLLEELKRLSNSNFEIGPDSWWSGLVKVANKTGVEHLVTAKDKDEDNKDKDKEGNDDGKKKDNGNEGENPGNVAGAERLPANPVQVDQRMTETTPSASTPTTHEANSEPNNGSENPRANEDEVNGTNKKDVEKKEPEKKQEKKKGKPKLDFKNFKELLQPLGSQATELIWEGITTIPDSEGNTVSKLLIARRITKVLGNLSDVTKVDDSRVVRNPKTGELVLDKERDDLLIATQTQIDEFVEDFLPSKIGPQATRAKEAMKRYADMITTRNNAKVEYNLKVKAYLDLDNQIRCLEVAQAKLNRQRSKFEAGHLNQMKQMSEDIFSWTKERTMRLLSLYRRAIYLATLTQPNWNSVGLGTNDASLSLPATALAHVHDRLVGDLFEAEDKAGSDAQEFPPKLDDDRGKFVQVDHKSLIKNGQLRIKLPPSTPVASENTLSDFRGCADVRIYRVRFFIEGVTIKPDALSKDICPIVDIHLTHEGDSVYYDPSGNCHTFTHETIDVKPSFRVSPSPDGATSLTAMDNGDIVSKKPGVGKVEKYAAPSPFATWTVSLRDVDLASVDLSSVTKAYFEFFGTSRSFKASALEANS
ncbi:hypothetical protein FSPOR_1636 [Fusarium sporotrichioides]|uniref:Uncharacterized protein n=1 Tax=Fusarium sporotrichioides TaxID=5514 RepID=A0A395SPH3_FUSSP|nr:hypothetical protein FSPOR_1636 [Fusarium sporotrichioides]